MTTAAAFRSHWIILLLFTWLLSVVVSGCGDAESEHGEANIGSFFSMESSTQAFSTIPDQQTGVPVLCYHYFRSHFDGVYLAKVIGAVIFGAPTIGDREFWTTPIGEFEKHLRYFRDNNIRVMTLGEVADLLEAGAALPEHAVVLTIDDADESVYRLAWPMLQKYGMRAHLFVPTGHAGSRWNDVKVCTWDQLREMDRTENIIVGSHTRDMHYKTKTGKGWEPVFWHPNEIPEAEQAANLADAMGFQRQHNSPQTAAATRAVLRGKWAPVAADLTASRYDIERELQRLPEWLAWPYGFAHGDLDSISRLVGFRGTVSLAPLNFAQDDTLLSPGRYTLNAKTTLNMIKGILPPR